MNTDKLIAQLTFELYELKGRMEKIRDLTDSSRDSVSIEVNNLCTSYTAYEDASWSIEL